MWTIYHNDNCSKSRAALALLTEKGVTFNVINYLKTPPSLATLTEIAGSLDHNIDAMVRMKDDAFAPIKDQWGTWSDAEKLAHLANNIALLERPIVVTDDHRAKIGRPDHTALLELFEENAHA
ncbi:ArsC/Spx/MgsR family protein [Wohlfahrtiimonas chitiniclastica]|uniref:ArsC/Spx/MgsR family protein n=1 Tax=Wohlfahrtiimonas chitiniclastica TaxID=400946 RepID=UPI000B981F47|nr:ArsC/Spx/MgsR family protein [Wohlfahrtiimonas chitiniclastica]OYQ74199.1 arsenate reductase [Wohlfahrtiimonas chitiniclastica]